MSGLRRAAIVAPVRTAVGLFGKALCDVPVEDLAMSAVTATIERAGIDPDRIDEVCFAQSYPNSETPCIGRWVALHAGLPEHVAGMQLDRRCGGGLQAIATAAMMVQTGAADVVVAGGVESMSRIEHYAPGLRWGKRAGAVVLHDRLDRGRERSQPVWRYGRISGMVETAENIARRYEITREAADGFAVQSHRRAANAWEHGRFAAEVIPVQTRTGTAPQLPCDEGVRADASMTSLAALKPIVPGGTVTAGNASQQNDAAAACLVVSEDRLDALGVPPIGFLVGWAAVGCDPAFMGLGPVPAVRRLFARTGLSFGDFGLVEVNEAFASQVLGVMTEWPDLDVEGLNVNGSGISLGHPIAATGVRIMTSLLHEMQRRGVRYGLETMCIGGGQGMAAAFEAA